MNIDLVYLSENLYGGWVTFTRHLYDALSAAGVNVRIVKLREHCGDPRNFGYGLTYQARTVKALALENSTKLIVALQKNYAEQAQALVRQGAGVVIHDHNEVKHLGAVRAPTVVIRKNNLALVPGSRFIPHPYLPQPASKFKKTVWARSVSRIDHDKNTHLLLLANRTLPLNRKIDIRGFDNRIYTRFRLMPQFPEYVQSKAHFPREKDAAFNLLAPVRYMVDMSTIKGDGGGSQYTFLEAANAGACCILHTDWCKIKGEMKPGVNCLIAGNEKELQQVLLKTTNVERNRVAANAEKLLQLHNPKKVAAQYVQFLQGLK